MLCVSTARFLDICFEIFPIFQKKIWIPGGMLRKLKLMIISKRRDPGWSTILDTFRSKKLTTSGVVKSERGGLVRVFVHLWYTVLTLRPVMCGGRRLGFCRKHL